MRKLHPACACLAGIVLQVVGFTTGPARAAMPDWITGFSADYQRKEYILGVGISDEAGSRAEKRGLAQSRAREEIAKQIRVRIRSKLFDATTEISLSEDRGAGSVSHSVIRNISKSSVDLEIEGVRIEETCFDEQRDLVYALAVLNRAEAARLTVIRIEGLFANARKELEQARLVMAQEEDSLGEALGSLFRAKAHLREAQRHGSVANVLRDEPYPLPDEPDLVEVLGRIDGLVARYEGEDLSAGVTALAYRVTREVDPDLKILVDRFTYRDTRFAGPFSLFLTQGLDAKLPAVGGGKVVDKRNVARALAVMYGNYAAADDPNAPEAFGRAADADAVLYGNYMELGDQVVVRAHLSGIDGERVASAELCLKRSLIDQAGLALVPPNYKRLQEELAYLHPPEHLRPKDLGLRVWTDRGDGGVYRAGEKMYVYLKATKDCYVRLVYHQADGTSVQIFPNVWAESRKVGGGKVYVIPGEDDRFEFNVCEPFGGEILKAYASTVPFPAMRGRELPGGLRVLEGTTWSVTRRMRGISVEAKSAETAEAICQVTTVAAPGMQHQ